MKKEKIDVFSWEMYLIIIMSYGFGFIGGWVHAWSLPFSLIFLAIPFYMKWKNEKRNNK